MRLGALPLQKEFDASSIAREGVAAGPSRPAAPDRGAAPDLPWAAPFFPPRFARGRFLWFAPLP